MTKPDRDAEGTEVSQTEGSDNADNQKGVRDPQYVTVEEFQKLNQNVETLRRALQSDKDKGVKRVEERVAGLEGDLKQVLQLAQQKNMSVEDLLTGLRQQEEEEARSAMIEMSRMFREGKYPNRSEGNGTSGVDVSAVLTELELDPTDTRVQAFRSKQFASEAEAYREGAKLLKQISTTRPDDADVPSREGRRQPAPTNQTKLMQEYQDRSKGVYGQALIRLKAEMRSKGLEIS